MSATAVSQHPSNMTIVHTTMHNARCSLLDYCRLMFVGRTYSIHVHMWRSDAGKIWHTFTVLHMKYMPYATDVSSYRPISNLSDVSKLLEHITVRQLADGLRIMC